MRVGVVGLGYVGLPTALLMADAGHDVVGVDLVKEKIEMINQGKTPIKEKGVQELLERVGKKLRATTEYSELSGCDAIVVCVPTPVKNRKMDASYLLSAFESIGKIAKSGQLIIVESTVTPGTTLNLIKPLLEKISGLSVGEDIQLAYVPERAIPGNALYEMIHNPRIVGVMDRSMEGVIKHLYSFVKGDFYITDVTTAEFVKVIENTYRDVNIALANELAHLAEKLGINVYEAINLANKHPRVNIHQPGIGVGGHCIPVDPWFLVEVDNSVKLIPTAREINDSMPLKAIETLLAHDVKKVTIFGVAYKPDVDDVRESPSLKVKELAEKNGMEVRIYDPIVFHDVDIESSVKGSQAIVIATAHSAFKDIEWDRISEMMEEPKLLFDGRGFFSTPPEGFKFYGIGRGDVM